MGSTYPAPSQPCPIPDPTLPHSKTPLPTYEIPSHHPIPGPTLLSSVLTPIGSRTPEDSVSGWHRVPHQLCLFAQCCECTLQDWLLHQLKVQIVLGFPQGKHNSPACTFYNTPNYFLSVRCIRLRGKTPCLNKNNKTYFHCAVEISKLNPSGVAGRMER